MARDERVEVWGQGEELRDNIFVEDLAKAIYELYKNNASGVYNIATGQSTSFLNMVEIIRKVRAQHFRVVYKKRTQKAFDQTFDVSKFRSLAHNFSFTTKQAAFKKTLIYYSQNS